jgi:gliding motility-associated-like protein
MKKVILVLFLTTFAAVLNAQNARDANYYICKSGPDFKLEMPNIFTPNGDYVNDHFLPIVTNEICLESFYVGIYDRWGQLLYETNVYSEGWHGNTFYGHPYPEGTYYYRMIYTVNDPHSYAQKTYKQNGYFQLVR